MSDHQQRPAGRTDPWTAAPADLNLFGGVTELLSPLMPGVAGLVPNMGETAQLFRGMFDEATSRSGLGHEVDDLMAKSPTLTGEVTRLQAAGWTVRFGRGGEGKTEADRDTKVITIAPSERGHTDEIVQSLSHEAGHAAYALEPEIGMEGLDERQYVEGNTMRNLRDEGEATINNLVVRREILDATRGQPGNQWGTDIGTGGEHAIDYEDLFAHYRDPAGRDRAALRDDIAKLYGDEEASGTRDNYHDYYAEPLQQQWAEAHPRR